VLRLRWAVRSGPRTWRTRPLADADQAGHLGEGEPLAALHLPQPPELLDALGGGEGAAAERQQGAAHVVLTHPDLPGDLGRVEGLAAGDLVVLVELLDALQGPPRRRGVLKLGAAAVGVGGLQRLELVGGRLAVADRLAPQASQPAVGLLPGAQRVQPLAGNRGAGSDLTGEGSRLELLAALELAGKVGVGDPVAHQPPP
jgi:hypothetical protein